MKRILIIGAQHGDERLGHKLYHYLRSSHSHVAIDFLCGNPKAYRLNIRFTETDLNRSYNVSAPRSYEEKRARKVLQDIAAGNYDFVLDIHTSRSDCDMFLIAASTNPVVKRIISATTMDRVTIMPKHIAKGSLIGNIDNAVSIEVARNIENHPQTLARLARIVGNLSNGASEPSMQRRLFYVDGTITNDVSINRSAKNFEKCNLGFYPVIFRYEGGSYSSYRGFRASSAVIETI